MGNGQKTDPILNPGQTGSVNVIGWFSVPAQALLNGATGTSIPSSRLKGQLSPGAPAPTSYPAVFTAFTQNAVGGIGTTTVNSVSFISRNVFDDIVGPNGFPSGKTLIWKVRINSSCYQFFTTLPMPLKWQSLQGDDAVGN